MTSDNLMLLSIHLKLVFFYLIYLLKKKRKIFLILFLKGILILNFEIHIHNVEVKKLGHQFYYFQEYLNIFLLDNHFQYIFLQIDLYMMLKLILNFYLSLLYQLNIIILLLFLLPEYLNLFYLKKIYYFLQTFYHLI